MRRAAAGPIRTAEVKESDKTSKPTYTQSVRRFRWTTLFLAALAVAGWSVVAFARGVALMVDDVAKYDHTVLIPALALIAVVIVLSLRFARRLWNCRPFGVEYW